MKNEKVVAGSEHRQVDTEMKQKEGEKRQLILLKRLKVLMLNQNLGGDGLEFLIGKSSTGVQMN